MTAVDLICIDVDGTLIGASGVVTPEVWAALKQLRTSGVRLAICSGRPAFGVTLEYAQRIDADGWHIFQNGASVVCPSTMETRSTAIAPAIVERLIARMHATKRVMELYTDREYAVECDTDRARRHADLLGMPYRPRAFSALTDPIVRAQWLLPIAQREAITTEPHAGLNLCPSLAPMMADTVFVNMTAEGVDKGSALRKVASAYDIPLARVMMIGDSHNDVPAFRIAGLAVAMGNAQQEAADAAHIRVGHVDEGGLLQALALAVRP